MHLGIDNAVDPLLRLFEIHGVDTVRIHDQLFATRLGEGLLIASSLDHHTEAGQWLLGEMLAWAGEWQDDSADFPTTRLDSTQVAGLSVRRTNSIIMLTEDWLFRTDSDQQGESANWASPVMSVTDWDTIQAARMWENQGYSYDGMAWYRKTIEIPEDWKNREVNLVAEGVDDAYRLWINGEAVALYGSFTEHAETVFRTKTETKLNPYLKFGEENLIVLQVVDVFGGGGITQPIYLRVE
jgi:hypothetical protein